MSPKPFRTVLACSTGLMVIALAPLAHAEAVAEVKEVVVQAKRVSGITSGLGGLGLGLKDTPQSVTVITQDQLRDQNLKTTNDVLDLVPGVNVERIETDRTYYNARGFDITTTQLDGVGLPLYWGIQYGANDTALYERVEVQRGAGGLSTATGNPSATINYVRKRPGHERRGDLSVQVGSQDYKRVDLDLSAPLHADSGVYGRLIYANEDKGSYLDHYHTNRNVISGLGSWEPTQNLSISLGYALQDHRARGVLWGALPLTYADGGRIAYDKGASTSADWTYWNSKTTQGFLSLSYNFMPDWTLRASLNGRSEDQKAKLLYAMGAPDRKTGLGVTGMAGFYPSVVDQMMADVQVSGRFDLFGRRHDLSLGVSRGTSWSDQDQSISTDPIVYQALTGGRYLAPPEPSYPQIKKAEKMRDQQDRLYGALRMNVTDQLKLIAGGSLISVKTTGYSFGVNKARSDEAFSPYAGVLYDLTPSVTLYASYTDIFNPQSEVDQNHNRLDPAEGSSVEAGVKSEWFDKRLLASMAVFSGTQKGLAEAAGTFPDGKSYSRGVKTTVSGYELEVTGKITAKWSLSGGFTDLSFDKQAGQDVRPYIPRRTLKLMTTYQVPEWQDLRVSAALRWQDRIKSTGMPVVTQDAYAVVDLSASARVTDKVRASVQVKNLFDERYLTSLMWAQSYLAQPRSVFASLSYSF